MASSSSGLGARRKLQHLLHRRDESQVAYGPDVRSTQRHEEVDVGGPRSDALDAGQAGVRSIVVQRKKGVEIEVTVEYGLGERASVGCFLAAEAGAA